MGLYEGARARPQGRVYVTSEEKDQLLALRMTAIQDAQYDWSLHDQESNEDNWPFRGVLLIWGRDRDGSVLASISVQTVGYDEVYRRNARLVNRSGAGGARKVPMRRTT